MIEQVGGAEEPTGLYQASVPGLGLVTHGESWDPAIEAARDLVSAPSVPIDTKEMPTGTFRLILKQAWRSEDAFRQL